MVQEVPLVLQVSTDQVGKVLPPQPEDAVRQDPRGLEEALRAWKKKIFFYVNCNFIVGKA